MLLPNGENAQIDRNKLTGYSLNREHPEGGADKARVFASVLGIPRENAFFLRDAVLEAARTTPVTARPPHAYGQPYQVIFALTGPNGNTANVKVGWIIGTGTDFPRLTICYVDL